MKIIPDRQQFVSFPFFKLDPAWRRLPDAERQRGKEAFCQVIESFQTDMIVLPYSVIGMRADSDFFLWRVGYTLEGFEDMTARLLNTGLGHYLSMPYAYLSMTRRSIYVDEHEHEGQEGNRLHIVPGLDKYVFIYPFIKTREWYGLDKKVRQEAMTEHIAIGHKFQSVKINTTYSYGLDDQEFVLAFESDEPKDFLELVMTLRETKASAYTLKDTPTFTGIRHTIQEIVDLLDKPAVENRAHRGAPVS
jgi:chlorite dismutase